MVSLCLFPPLDQATLVSELHALYLFVSIPLYSAWHIALLVYVWLNK